MNKNYQDSFSGDYHERRSRALEKNNLVLDFLWEETYADTKTVGELLGLGTQAATVTLKKLVEQGLVTPYFFQLMSNSSPHKFWGITRTGLILHRGEDAVVDCRAKHFQSNMVNAGAIRHKQAIQRVIIERDVFVRSACGSDFGSAGERGFSYKNANHYYAERNVVMSSDTSKGDQEPFAVPNLVFNVGSGVAVQVEISRKTTARYKRIFEGHYHNFSKRKLYEHVIYIAPTEKNRAKLEEVISSHFLESQDADFLSFFKERVRFTSFEAANVIFPHGY